jgi:putative N6-adenine-specific DNA methylase
MKIVITCAMGLESVLKYELKDLGYHHLEVDNGFITINGNLNDIPTLNLWTRIGARVFIELPPFQAESFDDLFDAVAAIDWAQWVPVDGRCTIDSVHSKQSNLYSQSDIQSITKKAIIESLKKSYPNTTFTETGPHIPIRLTIHNNTVFVRLDTSGHGLNKRGYRSRFDAPLRETLAAAIIKLSRWNPNEDALLDPCCGSGTILIEAGMMAQNIAPGLNQRFCSESWPIMAGNCWQDARDNAESQKKATPFRIYGSDINPNILKTARINIKAVGIDGIFVETKPISDIRSRFQKGKIICNPPYGIRLEDEATAKALYGQMNTVFNQYFPDWDYYILSGNTSFEDYFNQKATKKRKLFNGPIRCDLYQYF